MNITTDAPFSNLPATLTKAEEESSLVPTSSTSSTSQPSRSLSSFLLEGVQALKEKYNSLPTFPFPSLKSRWDRPSIFPKGIFRWISSSSQENPSNTQIPSAIALRKKTYIFFLSLFFTGGSVEDYTQYRLLLKSLDGYHVLLRKNPNDITDLLSTLDQLATATAKLKPLINSKDNQKNHPLKELENQIRKEKTILLLKKSIQEQITQEYKAEQVKFFDENIASGNLSKLSRLTYGNGEEGFFKPVSEIPSDCVATAGVAFGIPNSQSSLEAGLSTRNVLSYHVSQLLSESFSSLVPKTVFAGFKDQLGTFQLKAPGRALYEDAKQLLNTADDNIKSLLKGFQEDPKDARFTSQLRELEVSYCGDDQSIVVQENQFYRGEKLIEQEEFDTLLKNGEIEARAKVLAKVDETIDFKSPSLQKAMSQAHLFDLLTGQVDRNSGNFFYETKEDGSYQLHLIDNDQSFPPFYTDFSQETMEKVLGDGIFLKKLPRLVDKEAADAIEKLDPVKLHELLEKSNLTKEERSATLRRLDALKEHLTKIQNNQVSGGRIVEIWNEETYGELLQETYGELLQEKDNYISREVEKLPSIKSKLEHWQTKVRPEVSRINTEPTVIIHDDGWKSFA